VKKALVILIVSYRVRTECMDHIRKLHSIPDKENFYIISYQIPVSVFCVEFNSKPAGITNGFRRMVSVNNSGKTNKNRGLFSFLLEDLGPGILGYRFVTHGAICFKVAVGTGTASVGDSFRHLFPVKVTDFFNVV